MKTYKRKFKFIKRNTLLDTLFNSFIFILLVNWFFQGIRGMQLKELSFRIITEILLISIFFSLTSLNLLLCIIIIHTFFWVFLCQFWLINRYSLNYTNDLNKMNYTYKKVVNKILKFKDIKEAIVIGSTSSEKKIIKINSDLDLRIFFDNNFKNYLSTNFFLYYLRIYSFIKKFPLDIYCYDDLRVFNTFSKKDKILIIKDTNKAINKYLKK